MNCRRLWRSAPPCACASMYSIAIHVGHYTESAVVFACHVTDITVHNDGLCLSIAYATDTWLVSVFSRKHLRMATPLRFIISTYLDNSDGTRCSKNGFTGGLSRAPYARVWRGVRGPPLIPQEKTGFGIDEDAIFRCLFSVKPFK